MAFTPLSRAGWTVTADSTGFGLGVGNAHDGNNSTFWHSDSGYPHYLTVDMGSAQTFSGVQFVPRSDGTRTDPAQVAVYVSDDGTTWGSPVATDTWTSGATTKTLSFSSVTKRWFRFQGNTGADNPYMACTELYAGDPGLPSALVTQVAREALVGPAAAAARVTQAAVEVLAGLTLAAATEIRETQAALETVLESPPAAGVRGTQAVLETVEYPSDIEVWATQVCLEVVFPAGWCPPCPPVSGKRNHSFIGTSFSLQ